jgi:hypothetical protein
MVSVVQDGFLSLHITTLIHADFEPNASLPSFSDVLLLSTSSLNRYKFEQMTVDAYRFDNLLRVVQSGRNNVR